MNKQGALEKIKELEEYVRNCDKTYPQSPHQVTREDQLEVGVVVFYVHKFRPGKCVNGFISKCVVLSKPYTHSFMSGGVTRFADYMNLGSDSNYKSHFSLEDSGVVPNTYNHHRLFTNKAAAEAYLRSEEYNPNYQGL